MDLELQPELIVWTVITFGVLMGLLARFAFKPLNQAMEQREKLMEDSVLRAEEAKKAAEAANIENAKIVGDAREEARKLINEGHRVVSDMKKESRESSKREANVLVTRAREDIDRELQKGLTDLKGTVANLSVRISRQVIQDELDEKRHAELADEFVERLRRSHASRKQ